MKRLLFTAGLLLFLFAAHTGLVAQTTAQQTTSVSATATKSAQVNALFASVNSATPGAAVLVIQNGQILHRGTYGLARLDNLDNKEAIGPDTAFDLASTSKPFTAMAIMILVERGKLGYEDPLTKFFSHLPAYAQKVTIRHLLTHTSGLPDVISARWFKPGYEPTSREVAGFLIKEANPKSAPGERFEYNNTGYMLLALILEKASGQSFGTFMRENVFKPAGMGHSLIWDETKPKIEHGAISYVADNESFKPVDYVSDRYVYGAKGVISTVSDLTRWIDVLESAKLVKRETVSLAFTPTKLNDGSLSPYGFGWGIGSDGGLPIIEHPGGYLGYRTNIRLYPTEHLSIVVLANNAQLDAQSLTRSIGRIYLGEKMIAPESKVKLDPSLLEKYVGKYMSESPIAPDLLIEITLENSELYITSALRPKAKLLAQSETEFIISGTTATVTFKLNENGLVLKTRMGVINARKSGDETLQRLCAMHKSCLYSFS